MQIHKYARQRRRRKNFFLRKIEKFASTVKLIAQAIWQHPRMRIVALSAGGALVVLVVLLIALPGDGGEEEALALSGVQALRSADAGLFSDTGDIVPISAATPDPTPSPSPPPAPTPDPTLYYGVEDSERVSELQERLMDLGYLDIDEPTQHFGPITKTAVQLFQRQHDLQQDGIAGEETQAMIYAAEAKKYTLLEGMSGTDIDNFQRQLRDLGYLNKVTGYYGDETVAAVKAFQKNNGLSADGKCGQNTFDMINSDKAKASPDVAKEKRRKANIDTMIATAKKQLGKKYVLGNVGPKSFDCSGLVYYCLKEAGSNRRRLNAAGYSGVSDWKKITSYSDLKKGDLLFFYNNAKSKVGHVGIYLGGGEMIDASSANGKVVRRSCTTSYWKSHFVCARRPW